MKNIIVSLLMLCMLTGCGLNTFTTPTERVPLNLSQPAPLKLKKVEFVVIHKDNAATVFAELEKQGLQPVVFALTGADYKALAINVGDIKTHLLLQRKIIILYKHYYEGK